MANTRLRFGPYTPPDANIGDSLWCAYRETEVQVDGFSGALQWPSTLTPKEGGKKPAQPRPIVCGELVQAINREPATDLAKTLDTPLSTVSKWREMLRQPPAFESPDLQIAPSPGKPIARWSREIVEQGTATDPEGQRVRWAEYGNGKIELTLAGKTQSLAGWAKAHKISTRQLRERWEAFVSGKLPVADFLYRGEISELAREERVRLLGGPYNTPAVRAGDRVYCEFRAAKVIVGGLTKGPIPWPRAKKTGKASLIVLGDLAVAIRLESAIAVAEHWGVSPTTVAAWRRALGVTRSNPGTVALNRALAPQKLRPSVAERGRAKARSASSRAKIAAAKRGKPAHPNTKRGLLAVALREKSASHREAIRQAHIARGSRPRSPHPDLTEEEKVRLYFLARTGLPDQDIATKLGRSVDTVRKYRAPESRRPTLATQLRDLLTKNADLEDTLLAEAMGVYAQPKCDCGRQLVRRGRRPQGTYQLECPDCHSWQYWRDLPPPSRVKVNQAKVIVFLSAIRAGSSNCDAARRSGFSLKTGEKLARRLLAMDLNEIDVDRQEWQPRRVTGRWKRVVK